MTIDKRERLQKLEEILRAAKAPISGDDLAARFGVSRQVIVQDIGLLRARDVPILSTNRGYYTEKRGGSKRVFKVHHRDDQILEELDLIVDLGGTIEDVFVDHRIYGRIYAPMQIKSRKDVRVFMDTIYASVSTPLKNITDGYHFHTVSADDEESLNMIEDALENTGMLVRGDDPRREEA